MYICRNKFSIESVFSENNKLEQLYQQLVQLLDTAWSSDDQERYRNELLKNPDKAASELIEHSLETAIFTAQTFTFKRDEIAAILIYPFYSDIDFTQIDMPTISNAWGTTTAKILRSLIHIQSLYKKNPNAGGDDFRNLLLSFAEDMRVVLIMITNSLITMRKIGSEPDSEKKRTIAREASTIFAPLAHKLGLYPIKSELEDLSLKYLEHDVYYMIREKLAATKRAREEYVASFIAPIQQRLEEAGFHFHIKGRTKSIHSIWQKMKKQQCDFEAIYDLFAIRIILDAPIDKEKVQCWQVYAIVTDMYQPNPKRLRDWLSVPKSNGYESLHTTVMGPKSRWIEVQIRTQRMDDIAEHGLAAHWRYKGIKSSSDTDRWLNQIREALESGNQQTSDELQPAISEVYVFTPKGEILKFPQGATILDYAFRIHSKVGCTCVGARIDGKNVSIREQLKSGQTIEIITQSNQKPSPNWLNIVKTPRAKAKIRLALKETQTKDALFTKELLERRFKNKKIELEERTLTMLIKEMGFKQISDFYKQIAEGHLDTNDVIQRYVAFQKQLNQQQQPTHATEARFNIQRPSSEALVIEGNLKGIDYSLAHCCNPIFGDPVFGFVSANGGIKIHRNNCPNAAELKKRFPYRVVKVQWHTKGSTFQTILQIEGVDSMGIVNSITNIIANEQHINLQGIHMKSNHENFSGQLKLQISDAEQLNELIQKLKKIKGVRQVIRK